MLQLLKKVVLPAKQNQQPQKPQPKNVLSKLDAKSLKEAKKY
jgi:hypothetical protein